jgi:hypothetical protein
MLLIVNTLLKSLKESIVNWPRSKVRFSCLVLLFASWNAPVFGWPPFSDGSRFRMAPVFGWLPFSDGSRFRMASVFERLPFSAGSRLLMAVFY